MTMQWGRRYIAASSPLTRRMGLPLFRMSHLYTSLLDTNVEEYSEREVACTRPQLTTPRSHNYVRFEVAWALTPLGLIGNVGITRRISSRLHRVAEWLQNEVGNCLLHHL